MFHFDFVFVLWKDFHFFFLEAFVSTARRTIEYQMPGLLPKLVERIFNHQTLNANFNKLLISLTTAPRLYSVITKDLLYVTKSSLFRSITATQKKSQCYLPANEAKSVGN